MLDTHVICRAREVLLERGAWRMFNRSLFISFWLGCLTGAFAQETARRLSPPGEVICGYAGNYFAIEASQVKQGLSVQLLAGDAVAAKPVPLRFRVSQMPQ